MFKKGTEVTLKTNLVRKEYYGILPYFEDLEYWQCKVMTIQKSYIKEDCRLYIVNENNYTWAEEMIMTCNFLKDDKGNVVAIMCKEELFDCEGCTETGFKELTDCKECGRTCCKDCIIKNISLCLDCAKEDIEDGGDC